MTYQTPDRTSTWLRDRAVLSFACRPLRHRARQEVTIRGKQQDPRRITLQVWTSATPKDRAARRASSCWMTKTSCPRPWSPTTSITLNTPNRSGSLPPRISGKTMRTSQIIAAAWGRVSTHPAKGKKHKIPEVTSIRSSNRHSGCDARLGDAQKIPEDQVRPDVWHVEDRGRSGARRLVICARARRSARSGSSCWRSPMHNHALYRSSARIGKRLPGGITRHVDVCVLLSCRSVMTSEMKDETSSTTPRPTRNARERRGFRPAGSSTVPFTGCSPRPLCRDGTRSWPWIHERPRRMPGIWRAMNKRPTELVSKKAT